MSVDDIGVRLRPTLNSFAVEMEWKLRKNDHKKGWKELPFEALHKLFLLEYEEFKVASEYFGPGAAKKELVDMGNFIMMMWDRLEEDNKENAYSK